MSGVGGEPTLENITSASNENRNPSISSYSSKEMMTPQLMEKYNAEIEKMAKPVRFMKGKPNMMLFS